jgi:hypothetical protein
MRSAQLQFPWNYDKITRKGGRVVPGLVLLVLFLCVPFIMIVEIPDVMILYVGNVSCNVRLTFALKILKTTLFLACFVGISYFVLDNYSWRMSGFFAHVSCKYYVSMVVGLIAELFY